MRPPPTVCRRARAHGREEIWPASARERASTAWISAYPWDETGLRPSEASIDESASLYSDFCTPDIERKKTEPLYAPTFTVPVAGFVSSATARRAAVVVGSK